MSGFCGTIAFYLFAVKQVPITGRRQLEMPEWIQKMSESQTDEKNSEQFRQHIETYSWEPDDQTAMTLNRLIRSSGLDDRDWELRVVNAPSE